VPDRRPGTQGRPTLLQLGIVSYGSHFFNVSGQDTVRFASIDEGFACAYTNLGPAANYHFFHKISKVA